MSGPVVLHGGGEYETGDEECISAVLGLGLSSAGSRADPNGPIRVVVVPTATARWDPARSASHGVAAFRRIAAQDGLSVEASVALIVDEASAADGDLADLLASADVVAFPGGDPDLIVSVMRGSRAWTAIEQARDRGAVLTGASAGAMALAPWTWTPGGGVDGMDIVPGIVVVPHADAASWDATVQRFGAWAPAGLGPLGLAERTAAITMDPTTDPVAWQVVGRGDVRWLAARGEAVAVYGPGDHFETPGKAPG